MAVNKRPFDNQPAEGAGAQQPRARLEVVPLSLAEANTLVRALHRHHRPVVGHKFSIGVALGSRVVGCAIVGRPRSRHLQDGWTVEVLRVATDGTPNACSCLLGAAWQAARRLGYRRAVTYTLPSEGGASLRGAGWRCVGISKGGPWSRASRPRVDDQPLQCKWRWEAA